MHTLELYFVCLRLIWTAFKLSISQYWTKMSCSEKQTNFTIKTKFSCPILSYEQTSIKSRKIDVKAEIHQALLSQFLCEYFFLENWQLETKRLRFSKFLLSCSIIIYKHFAINVKVANENMGLCLYIPVSYHFILWGSTSL